MRVSGPCSEHDDEEQKHTIICIATCQKKGGQQRLTLQHGKENGEEEGGDEGGGAGKIEVQRLSCSVFQGGCGSTSRGC